MNRPEIRLAPINTLEGFHDCERLQQATWGFRDMAVVPHHLLITVQKHGGLLLGAYAKDDEEGAERLIGLLFGFPGMEQIDGRWQPKHCSLMCAVLPEWRAQGIAYRLKLAQRDFVRAQGLELVTWTFDPLVSRNAHFNFAKLGVIARRYEVDYYGNMGDELNRGLPTDRFTVEWWVQSPRIAERIEHPSEENVQQMQKLPHINETAFQDDLLINKAFDLAMKGQALLVEIPWDIEVLKQRNLSLAQRWRLEIRQIFTHYFQRDYLVSEFFADHSHGKQAQRSYYLLERISREEVLKRGARSL
jgi:predicted GNAT superfamily acetyltransferase